MHRRHPPGNVTKGLKMWIPPRRSTRDEEEEEKDGSDMQIGSEEDAGDEMDVEGKEEAEDAVDVEPEPSEPESTPSSPPPAAYPRLKIKLKLPTSTPSFSASTSQPPSRRSPSRDIDIESEDDSNGDNVGSSDSEAAILAPKGKGKGKKPMTARQAVLASVAGSSQSKLLAEPTTTSTKKKHLTDSEIALRREETARKRKNLSEKKLEDEKAETINRLLKKQSRPQAKNKRVTASSTNVPSPAQGGSDADEAEVEGEVGYLEDDDPGKPGPEMYRWVSSAAGLSFSVPVNFLPSAPDGTVADPASKVSGSNRIPLCDVSDCNEARKYRLVADMQKGACGMEHLKALEGRV